MKGNYPSDGISQSVADPERLELPTPAFEAQCSIHLSYGSAGSKSLSALLSRHQQESQPLVIVLTAFATKSRYPKNGYSDVSMAVSGVPLNRFERILFGAALALGAIVVVIRIAVAFLIPLLRHSH